jgi:hypothetical protein
MYTPFMPWLPEEKFNNPVLLGVHVTCHNYMGLEASGKCLKKKKNLFRSRISNTGAINISLSIFKTRPTKDNLNVEGLSKDMYTLV